MHELGSHQLLTSLHSPSSGVSQDLLEKGLEADNFAMLGLGDIVIPGDGGQGRAKVQGGEGFHGEGNTAFLTRRGEEGGVRLCDSPSPPAQGLVKGSTSTHTEHQCGLDLGGMLVSRTAFTGAWLGEQTLLKSCRNKCI